MGGKTNGSKERGVGETVAKESGGGETIVKAMRVSETGGKVSGGKAAGAQVTQETGGKGDRLMSEREPDNSLPPSDKAAAQNVMQGIHRNSYSEAVIEGERKRARVFVGDSIVRKTGAKIEANVSIWRTQALHKCCCCFRGCCSCQVSYILNVSSASALNWFVKDTI